MRTTGLILGVWLAAISSAAWAGDAGEIFERRILPIAKSPRASSCTECHFAGVDLKQYILDDAAQTFAALREQGLLDVERPKAEPAGLALHFQVLQRAEEVQDGAVVDREGI